MTRYLQFTCERNEAKEHEREILTNDYVNGDRGLRECEGGERERKRGPGEFSSTTSQLHRIRVEYFIRRPSSDENEKDGVVQPAPLLVPLPVPHSHSPSYGLLTGNLPRLPLTVLSLYSPALRCPNGGPSFLFLASFPVFHPYPSCLVASTAIPLILSTPRPLLNPLSRGPFILRAVRSSLRRHELREVSATWNPFVCRALLALCLSSRTFPAPLRWLSRQKDRNWNGGECNRWSRYSGKKRWQLIGAVCARHLELLKLAVKFDHYCVISCQNYISRSERERTCGISWNCSASWSLFQERGGALLFSERHDVQLKIQD